MKFEHLIQPLTIEEFTRKVIAGETILMPGHGRRDFTHLLSLEEIEAVINNGCNINMPMQMVVDGERQFVVDEKVNWSPVALKKREVLKLLQSGHSFMMMNMSQINRQVAELIDTIENSFTAAYADLHLYVSPKEDSTGYRAHRDRPQHKIYLQVIGRTDWKIFTYSDELPEETVSLAEEEESKYLQLDKEFTMEPGDVFYMPPDVFHKVRNYREPRVSFSIPFIIERQSPCARMDRTYIPFKKIFESSGR